MTNSCRYGISIAVQNHLDSEILFEVFPIQYPYSSETEFTLPAGDQISFHWQSGIPDESLLKILSEIFKEPHLKEKVNLSR